MNNIKGLEYFHGLLPHVGMRPSLYIREEEPDSIREIWPTFNSKGERRASF